jgi:hypothetical protein
MAVVTPAAKERKRLREKARSAMNRQLAANKRAAGFHGHAVSTFPADHDARRLMQLIPADTRDLTARLMGDPIPGRRAIDRRQPA